PLDAACEDLQPSRRQPRPHFVNIRFRAALIRQGKTCKPQFPVDLKELLAIIGIDCCGITDTRNPTSTRFDCFGVYRWLRLAAFVRVVYVNDIGFPISRSPDCCSPVKAGIHAVSTRPMRRDIEVLYCDIGFGDWEDGAGAEIRDAFSASLSLMRR